MGRPAGATTVIVRLSARPLSLLFNLPACGLLLGFLAFDGLADVVAGGGPLVLRCGRAVRGRAGGFRRAGGHGECLADAAKAPADAGGGEAAGLAGLLPGQADVGGEVAGEAELGVAGDDQPGPAVGGGRVAELRPGPAELLLQEPERVLDVETAQECLPGAVHLVPGGTGAGGPQPQRLRVTLAGQVIHGEPDEGSLDDGQLAVVALPAAAVLQPLVQPGPGHRGRGAVPGRVRDGGDGRARPGRRLAEDELVPVPGPPPARGGRPCRERRGREVHDPVAAQPPGDVNGQVVQQPGQPGQVVAGIEDHDDVRVALAPVPGGDQPGDDAADLDRRDLGGVIGRSQPHRVQRQRPRRTARLQRHDPGVRPAGNHLRVPLAPRVTVAEQPLRAGLRVRPQPVAHIHSQPDPAILPLAQRDPGNRPPQPADPDLPAVQRIIDAAVPAAALRLQAQLRQHVHPLRPARQRVGHLEQHVPAHPQRAVQLAPEPRQPRHRAIRPIRVLMPGHNESHGHRLDLQVLWKEPEDHQAVAASCHHDTPGQHKQLTTTRTRVK